jgi:hypothetical protein
MFHEILSESFSMLHVAAKSVPSLLSEGQDQNHVDVSR